MTDFLNPILFGFSYPAGRLPTNKNQKKKKDPTSVAVMMMIRQPEQEIEIRHNYCAHWWYSWAMDGFTRGPRTRALTADPSR